MCVCVYVLAATGWGTLSYKGRLATTLQEVELTAWNNAKCQSVWRDSRNDSNYMLLASQLCASRPGKDTCSGDSGGPLLLKVRRGGLGGGNVTRGGGGGVK